MGDHFEAVVDTEVTAPEAGFLAEHVQAWLVARGAIGAEPTQRLLVGSGHPPGEDWLSICERREAMGRGLVSGLEVTVGRTFFSCYENGPELTCAACEQTFIPGDGYAERVGAWCNGDEGVRLACSACGHEDLLTAWTGEWPDGFGNLGFTFWNWPPLSKTFVEELGRLLGHRTRRVRGRL